jgi:hypothetical protein
MTTYTAYFRTDANFATREFKAATPEQALKKARRFHRTHADQLSFERYDDSGPVNQIDIWNDQGDDLAVWHADDLRLRLAAQDLLDAVEFCAMTLYDLEASKRKGYIAEAIRLAQAALAKAKGGAA